MSRTDSAAAEQTGAEALVSSLEHVGAEVVFGIPGGAILPAYDPLFESTVRHILVRHEQGAGHAAEGYAVATGKVGVCMATSGPGRDQPGHADRRRVHGLGADGRDHRPGRRARRSGRTPSRRPTSAASRCRSPSTASWSPTPRTSPAPSPPRSTSPRPAGPARCWSTSPRTRCRPPAPFAWPPKIDLPGYHPVTKPHAKQVREAARLISASRRPVLYVGGGVVKARAWDELKELAELTGIPVVTTLMARGRVPGQPPAEHGHARHARHRGRGRRAAAQPTC